MKERFEQMQHFSSTWNSLFNIKKIKIKNNETHYSKLARKVKLSTLHQILRMICWAMKF